MWRQAPGEREARKAREARGADRRGTVAQRPSVGRGRGRPFVISTAS